MKKNIILIYVILFISPTMSSYAGFLKNSVPIGKEIKDHYLEQLFAPEFPCESVKVIETKEGKRYVVIKAKKYFSKEMEKEYQSKTLRQRNISIRRIYNPHTGVLMIGEIKLVRKVSDVPYVVEYCMAEKSANKDVAWRDGKFSVIVINKDFGKIFKTLTLYPEKEADCSFPPYVGKYPDSRSLGCYKSGSSIIFTFVSKAEPQKIYDFYKDKLKKHYDDIGFWFPETYWDSPSWGFGMLISNVGIEEINKILGAIKEKTIPPPGGVIFTIRIYGGAPDAEALIHGYTFIKVFYQTDQTNIKENIRRMDGIRR